jgi:hypothetical protein
MDTKDIMTNDGHGLQAMDFRPDLETEGRRPKTM